MTNILKTIDGNMVDRGEVLLACIYDDVDNRLNPGGEECWHCGGEGETYDCIDGCCVDAESGCPDCARPCIECRIAAGQRAKAIREEVIKSDDIDIARAWIKEQGRLRADTTDDMIREQMAAAKAELEKTAQPTAAISSNPRATTQSNTDGETP